MANDPPKVDLNSVKGTTIGNGKQFSANVAKLGDLLGMTKIGCTLVELEPGNRAWPYHLHYGQEEVFVVLEGQGTLRYDDDEYEIREGEIFSPGIGSGTAHQIVNTSESTLRYLALSSMDDPEVIYYPDAKKHGAFSDHGGGVQFIAPDDSSVGYLEVE